MRWFRRKVAVTLIDDKTGAVFATTAFPPGDLPESFEIATTLHLGAADWSVVHAEPRTRIEYAKTCSLTLRLRRVEKIDPSKVLFSLPSICDRLAPVGSGALSGDECVLTEDDWRQLELVSRCFAEESDAEIEAVRRIHEQESASVGWRKLHVRQRPDPPISAHLTLKALNDAFGGACPFHGVAYAGYGSSIESGYSFRATDGLQCYGVADAGRVTVLGIVQEALASPPDRSTDALVQVAKEFDLDLVNWCRCQRASAENPLFGQMLRGG